MTNRGALSESTLHYSSNSTARSYETVELAALQWKSNFKTSSHEPT
ncbi:hypothetical protein ACU8KH_00787 [Lachancea thermotolerans]